MKKILGLLFAVFFFVACGEKSPEDVAKTFYESLMKAV